jgi:hypothetical protein
MEKEYILDIELTDDQHFELNNYLGSWISKYGKCWAFSQWFKNDLKWLKNDNLFCLQYTVDDNKSKAFEKEITDLMNSGIEYINYRLYTEGE